MSIKQRDKMCYSKNTQMSLLKIIRFKVFVPVYDWMYSKPSLMSEMPDELSQGQRDLSRGLDSRLQVLKGELSDSHHVKMWFIGCSICFVVGAVCLMFLYLTRKHTKLLTCVTVAIK